MLDETAPAVSANTADATPKRSIRNWSIAIDVEGLHYRNLSPCELRRRFTFRLNVMPRKLPWENDPSSTLSAPAPEGAHWYADPCLPRLEELFMTHPNPAPTSRPILVTDAADLPGT